MTELEQILSRHAALARRISAPLRGREAAQVQAERPTYRPADGALRQKVRKLLQPESARPREKDLRAWEPEEMLPEAFGTQLGHEQTASVDFQTALPAGRTLEPGRSSPQTAGFAALASPAPEEDRLAEALSRAFERDARRY